LGLDYFLKDCEKQNMTVFSSSTFLMEVLGFPQDRRRDCHSSSRKCKICSSRVIFQYLNMHIKMIFFLFFAKKVAFYVFFG